MAVTPIVGYLGSVDPVKLSPSKTEIAEVFLVPVEQFIDPERVRFHETSRGVLPSFHCQHTIWGLTAYILYHFLDKIVQLPLPKQTVNPITQTSGKWFT